MKTTVPTAGSPTFALPANRWYDRLFRLCLYIYWVLAAWHVALISQYWAVIRSATHDGSSDMIRLLPVEPIRIALGGKVLVFDWGLVAIMLSAVFVYLLLGLCATGFYKTLRWQLGGRETVTILSEKVRWRAILLALLYWAACWGIYCFSGNVADADEAFFYAVVATSGLLVPAAVLVAVALWEALRWLLKKPYFMPAAEGADVIRRFAAGRDTDWEWDDFITAPQVNPEVELAVALCNHLAWKYPAQRTGEFCAAEGIACFFEVADALEQGLLAGVVVDKIWWARLDAHAALGVLLPWLRKQAAEQGDRPEDR